MSHLPPLRRIPPAPSPCTPVDAGLVFGVAVARYRNQASLRAYLGALDSVQSGRLVVVVGLRGARRLGLQEFTHPSAKLIFTTDAAGVATEPAPGWFEPNPFRAVATAMCGLEQGDALLLIFPTDWRGKSPEELVDEARRWRAGPHSPVDDVYFLAASPL